MSRQELACHFHCSEDALEAMLWVWMRKGRVVVKRENRLCGGSCCGKRQEVMFEWREPGQIGVIHKS